MNLSSITCQLKEKTMTNELQQELEGGTSGREREEFWEVVGFTCNCGEDSCINLRKVTYHVEDIE